MHGNICSFTLGAVGATLIEESLVDEKSMVKIGTQLTVD